MYTHRWVIPTLIGAMCVVGASDCSASRGSQADKPSATTSSVASFCATYADKLKSTGKANRATTNEMQVSRNTAKMYRDIGNAAPQDAVAVKKSTHKLFLLYGKAANGVDLNNQDIQAIGTAESVVADYAGTHCQAPVAVPSVK
ncbi:hypothetical protein PV379_00360 [Streptomyces caniscabiei]|uniref:hypothetical protein n=1 Tax=Streptomyces caniscabiei TaxID=2746961 RepID=UPI0029B74649|nr:hypothetical protein [Streptomyces caniscabiei]MDX2775809.1 hypothetical protein [Streptomyces caniscabiei]